jgi:hypothetical protein
MLLFAMLALSSVAAAATSVAPSARGPGEAVDRKLCRAIRPQHVRALFTGAAAPIRLGGDADCAFRLPSVVDARRGSFTCTLIPVGTAGLAIPTGSALAAARSYARRLLALCDDVYAAHG